MGGLTMRSQQGFTLTEMLVAMVISLVLVGGAIVMLSNSSDVSRETSNTIALTERLRLAIDQMAYDIRMAGFTGCSRDVVVKNNIHDNQIGNSNKLLVTTSGLEGLKKSSGTTYKWLPSDTSKSSDLSLATDADNGLTIRYVEATRSTPTKADASVSDDIVIASDSASRYSVGDILAVTNCQTTDIFVLSSAPSDAGAGKKGLSHKITGNRFNKTDDLQSTYKQGSFVGRAIFKRYYIGEFQDEPTLMVRQPTFKENKLVEEELPLAIGIQSMSILYGVDTTAGGDGKPDTYKEASAMSSSDWSSIISLRYTLTARSEDANNRITKSMTNTVLIRNLAL